MISPEVRRLPSAVRAFVPPPPIHLEIELPPVRTEQREIEPPPCDLVLGVRFQAALFQRVVDLALPIAIEDALASSGPRLSGHRCELPERLRLTGPRETKIAEHDGNGSSARNGDIEPTSVPLEECHPGLRTAWPDTRGEQDQIAFLSLKTVDRSDLEVAGRQLGRVDGRRNRSLERENL